MYRECCDREYGPGGLALCFLPPELSFERCCPPPDDIYSPLPNKLRTLAISWYEPGHQHCKSQIAWIPPMVASMMTFGSDYHALTGEVLSGDNSSVLHSKVTSVRNHLQGTRDLRLEAFIGMASRYYESGEVAIELMHMINDILLRFVDTFSECPEAAFLAAFLKTEAMFEDDGASAQRSAHQLRHLLLKTMNVGLLRPPLHWPVRRAIERLETLGRRTVVSATVDIVIAVCGPADVDGASFGLREAFNDMSLPAQLRTAFSLHLADACGHLATSFLPGPLRFERLASAFLGGLAEETVRLFRRESGRGSLRVSTFELDEEVPPGDVVAYATHIAAASKEGRLANVTLLLHPDFAEHVRLWALRPLLRSLARGSWPYHQVDFLYLGWRHEGPVKNHRVAYTVRSHCDTRNPMLGPCLGEPEHPLSRNAIFGDFNPVLLDTIWREIFGVPYDKDKDDFGGYDFSQLLVSQRAASARPASFWRRLATRMSSKASFQLLPGTKFISTRVDLSARYGYNKGVCIWFEHMWHLLFDPLFFPERPNAGSNVPGGNRDLRAFTRLGDPRLPLGYRVAALGAPDSIMIRHYWLNAHEQCSLLKDRQACALAAIDYIGCWTRSLEKQRDALLHERSSSENKAS